MENVCSNTSHPNRASISRKMVNILLRIGRGSEEVYRCIASTVAACKLQSYILPLDLGFPVFGDDFLLV